MRCDPVGGCGWRGREWRDLIGRDGPETRAVGFLLSSKPHAGDGCERPQTVVFVPFVLDGDGDGLGSASTATLRLSILHSQLSGMTKAESRGCENTVSHAAGVWCGRKSGGKVVKRAVDAGRNRGCRGNF
jgi:hypothetical protein